MPKATNRKGALNNIDQCWLYIPNFGTITVNNLPELGDSKNAVYNSDGIIGRSNPLHTYSYSDNRTVSIQFHFFVVEEQDIDKNLRYLRAIESCVYPREGQSGMPYAPPPICEFKCGDLIATESVCVICQQYSVKFPTEVAWDKRTLCPYKFDIDSTWWVVYDSMDLPDQSRIIRSGR